MQELTWVKSMTPKGWMRNIDGEVKKWKRREKGERTSETHYCLIFRLKIAVKITILHLLFSKTTKIPPVWAPTSPYRVWGDTLSGLGSFWCFLWGLGESATGDVR